MQSPIQAFLRRSTLAGEKTVAYVRLGLCVLVMVERAVFLDAFRALVEGQPQELIAVSGLLIGALFSIWAIWRSEHNAPRRLPEVSAIVDVLLISLIMLPQSIWTPEHWAGVLTRPSWAFWALSIVAAGFRLSRTAVVAATALATLSIIGHVTLDISLNGPEVAPEPVSVVLAAIIFCGATLLGWGVVVRTRSLVDQGAQEAIKAERARQRLGVYVSQEIADQAMEVELLRPGGERRNVAVLFSDLRGFTTRGESLQPEQLLEELNSYLDEMVAVIRAHDGVVDKYIGDAIMVVFGIPESHPDDAARAIACARGMQEALASHNAARAARGKGPLRHGIGVHYGPVVAGNVGTSDRLQYTVVGDIVNTASRLEGATKSLQHPVVISREAVVAAGGAEQALGLCSLGRVPIRGREGGIEVLTLADDPSPWASQTRVATR